MSEIEGQGIPEERQKRLDAIRRRRAQAAFQHSAEQAQAGREATVESVTKDTRPEAVQKKQDITGLEDTLASHETPQTRFRRLTSKDGRGG